ncbi:hypothetical protein P8A18_17520 [Streptomyces castrisilvae]|uniref:Uncharacterized protein n=1 Tax=Streptomyces castrisilvae TaxID=3033811 RepID=A0ABY9HKP2_9ACTN|nr:hypothetical protein [Streptomyces sp. Mut1]WLQ35121.1 hypothetical protein P8A18_17520 [Streptomyces sp. Mut1]
MTGGDGRWRGGLVLLLEHETGDVAEQGVGGDGAVAGGQAGVEEGAQQAFHQGEGAGAERAGALGEELGTAGVLLDAQAQGGGLGRDAVLPGGGGR